jgi:hypothetical protein
MDPARPGGNQYLDNPPLLDRMRPSRMYVRNANDVCNQMPWRITPELLTSAPPQKKALSVRATAKTSRKGFRSLGEDVEYWTGRPN